MKKFLVSLTVNIIQLISPIDPHNIINTQTIESIILIFASTGSIANRKKKILNITEGKLCLKYFFSILLCLFYQC